MWLASREITVTPLHSASLSKAAYRRARPAASSVPADLSWSVEYMWAPHDPCSALRWGMMLGMLVWNLDPNKQPQQPPANASVNPSPTKTAKAFNNYFATQLSALSQTMPECQGTCSRWVTGDTRYTPAERSARSCLPKGSCCSSNSALYFGCFLYRPLRMQPIDAQGAFAGKAANDGACGLA
ncbi:hypothetical protein EJ05DRAFT_184278 [Pseudovirgaria hyperparasitica]|uniref:Uncharacterized protein n=1 Tax=Pseudovirgaria hyperparasitica TaxID=470096 RepID=A0A6A6WJV4_9PEZI|nr:uncharacterized protein EJ05DRAFT_184278 [Pseudovirgaria hyperparasitica]KAF2761761.1 hypothetical protein EJ05DRAFT_184278 [Pseudovirgaria hyperparasitica]